MTLKNKKLCKTNKTIDDIKHVNAAHLPNNKRTPRFLSPILFDKKPLWAFRYVDIGGPWCWKCMNGEDLGNVLKRLADFESKNWSELHGMGCHLVDVDNLCAEAKKRITQLQHDDQDQLYSFRINGAQRVWGIKIGDLVYLLWWDPKHRICPSSKKGT